MDDDWLRAQRARIEERLEQPRPLRPALTMVAMLVLAVYLSRPAMPPAEIAAGDAALIDEVYTMIQDDEPRATMPVHALFEAQ